MLFCLYISSVSHNSCRKSFSSITLGAPLHNCSVYFFMAPAQAFLCRYLWYFSLEIPLSYLKALLCIVNDLSEVEVPSLWLLLNQDRNVTTGLATEFSRGELVFSNKRWRWLKVIPASLRSAATTEREKKGQNPLGFLPVNPSLRINREELLLCHRSPELSMKALCCLWEIGRKYLPRNLCSIPASGSGKSVKLNSKKRYTLWVSLPRNSLPRTTDGPQEQPLPCRKPLPQPLPLSQELRMRTGMGHLCRLPSACKIPSEERSRVSFELRSTWTFPVPRNGSVEQGSNPGSENALHL